jgi:hypothetical protein
MEIGAIGHTESCENYAEIERRQTPQFAILSGNALSEFQSDSRCILNYEESRFASAGGKMLRFSGAKTMIACGRRNDFNEWQCSCARDAILIPSAPASVSGTLAALPSMSSVPLASFFS